jgi:hypothetical protein
MKSLRLDGGAVLTRVMASLMFGISGRDGIAFSSAVLILALLALLASFSPRRRAIFSSAL